MKTGKIFYPLLIVLILLSGLAWYKFSYPRFAVIDVSVNRTQAMAIAKEYLRVHRKADPSDYLYSIVFNADNYADRYLQKAVGFEAEEQFIGEHNLDLFVWVVRFMREGEKEEFRLAISSKTGEVISFGQQLDDAAARPSVDEEAARRIAEEFLRTRFNFDFEKYAFHSKSLSKLDNRVDHTFYWEKKGVYVTWDPDPKSGGARLLTNVIVSGEDVLSFSKQVLSPPDQFSRDIEKKRESGRNLGLISSVLSLGFLIGAIWIVVLRKNHLAMNVTKSFYVGCTLCLFALGILSELNNIQGVIAQYPTTQPFGPYLARQMVMAVLGQFFVMACFVIPCLAGELLHFEVFPKKPQGGFFHYVTTTFFSRDVARTIILGYAFTALMIGLQSIIFEFGFRNLGVWLEQTRLNQLSSGHFPFLAAISISLTASLTEETLFRMFGVGFGTKFFKNTAAAVIISSVVWGLGHTNYPVYPYWFRGLEVTLLGIFVSAVYLRFGLLCVVIMHFLFDAFWGSSPYLFGRSDPFNLSMMVVVLALPLIWAIAAFIKNRPVVVREIHWRLTPQQKYNVEIIKGFILRKRAEPGFLPAALKEELVHNGWDVAIIEVAFVQLGVVLPGAVPR